MATTIGFLNRQPKQIFPNIFSRTTATAFIVSSAFLMALAGAPETAFAKPLPQPISSLAQSSDFDKAKEAFEAENFEKAWPLLQSAAEAGSPEAMLLVGTAYLHGRGVPQDYGKAMKNFTSSARRGNNEAQFLVGQMYAEGQGVAQDYEQAVKWYRKAAEAGYVPGQIALGKSLQKGQGITKNKTEAAKWFRKAAASGNLEAKKCLQEVNSSNAFVPMQQRIPASTKATVNESPADDGGYGEADSYPQEVEANQPNNGNYQNQNNQNNQQAKQALKPVRAPRLEITAEDILNLPIVKPSAAGVSEYKAGMAYYYDRLANESAEYFSQAAAKGQPNACFIMWLITQRGLGVQPDSKKAFDYLNKAATAGIGAAQLQLSLYYYDGRVVMQNFHVAKNWALQAAAKKIPKADKMVEACEFQISIR